MEAAFIMQFLNSTALLSALLLVGCGGESYIRPPSQEPFSYQPWDSVLKQHVDNDGYVNYEGVRSDSAFWRFVGMLNGAKPSQLGKPEQLAFWINAYNALTFQLICDNLEKDGKKLASITDLAAGLVGAVSPLTSPWELEVAKIEGKTMTLQQIEDDYVRKLGDERIHFAINCASISCPKVMREAWTAENMDRLYAEGRAAYLSNPAENRFSGDTLYLSEIFISFYPDDFKKAEGSVAKYVAKYWPNAAEAKKIAEIPDANIQKLSYNWGLVSQENKKE